MKQAIKKGNNKELFILLHGTGGSAEDLFPLASKIDANATLIGLEGRVSENGLKRYFKRYSNGSFDLESLEEESIILKDEIQSIIESYREYNVTVIGYSNGANIFLNLLKKYEDIKVSKAVLLHPSPVRMDVEFKKQSLELLLTSGANDPFITEEQFESLVSDLKLKEIKHEVYKHQWGHQIIEEEYTVMETFTRGHFYENNN